MAYEIKYSRKIRNQLRHLPGNIKAIAKQEIASLSGNPRPSRGKELEGYPHYYRLWLSGHYRLVWSVDDNTQILEICYLGLKTSNLYAYLGLARPIDDED